MGLRLAVVMIVVFSVGFIVIVLGSPLRSLANERAIDVDVVKNGRSELVRTAGRILAFVEYDRQTLHRHVADGRQDNSVSEGCQRCRSTPAEPLPPHA